LLYIHKNTLVYRYGQLKELLGIDPVASSRDRAFLGGFYLYLSRSGEQSSKELDP
jgi:carbohydrate diacid regulator